MVNQMPRNHTPKPDNPEEYKRFLETAREAGAVEQGDAFDRVLRKVAGALREPKPTKGQRRHDEA
jgi:hypothetical protein